MSRALIIGAGGVAGVVAHKCCENFDSEQNEGEV